MLIVSTHDANDKLTRSRCDDADVHDTVTIG